jgi:cyclic pyranopterin phosphate synthase
MPFRDGIVDRRGRRIDYARISVTDRCNYRCIYCMPPEGVPPLSHDDIMRYEDILWLAGILSELGVKKTRFTGGEPLVRRGMAGFLKDFRDVFPEMALSVTTNASLVAQNARALAQVPRLGMNISLDTLDPDKFREMTRGGDIMDVMSGIAAARDIGISPIKINAVPILGFNDSELPRIIEFAWDNGIVPRFIEFMPLCHGVWTRERFMGSGEILRVLREKMGEWALVSPCASADGDVPSGPARYYSNAASGLTAGIIEAVSNHFCSRCNRLRITSSGGMRSCLFNGAETPLFDVVKSRDTASAKREILRGIDAKPLSWNDVRNGRGHMSGIGG